MANRSGLSRKRDTRVPQARRLRRAMTDAERKLWWHLREARLKGTHFRRQATIGRYFVDFCCHTRRLVIEIDGGGHAERRRIFADECGRNFSMKRDIVYFDSGITKC